MEIKDNSSMFKKRTDEEDNPPPHPQEESAKQRAKDTQGEWVLQFMKFDHLQGPLAAISEPFCTIAQAVVDNLPRNPERTVCLRKLLEAKDAAIRAFIAG